MYDSSRTMVSSPATITQKNDVVTCSDHEHINVGLLLEKKVVR